MAMAITQIADLHVLHWLISAAVPVLLVILALVDRLVLHRTGRGLNKTFTELIRRTEGLEARGLKNWPAILSDVRTFCPTAVQHRFEQLDQDRQQLYQGRWLPDLEAALPLSLWLTPAQRSAMSSKPVARILASGLLAAVIAWLIQIPLPVSGGDLSLLLILLPPLTAAALTILIFAVTQQTCRQLTEQLGTFTLALSRYLPVFNDQTGIATLVDAYLNYDHQMQEKLQQFTDVTARLAESDMADGIRRSIEQVLTESVAPSLQQSTTALGELAGELTQRQERGMQQLAEQFATALSSQLVAHMQPINREISQMGSLMTDVKNYIEVAMRAMDTARQQSTQIQQDVDQSLQRLSSAHETINTDFAAVREQITALSGTTTQLAQLQQKNETALNRSLDLLGQKLAEGIQSLSVITDRAVTEAGCIKTAAEQQETVTGERLDVLTQQTDQFSRQLARAMEEMLKQVQQETSTIAVNTREIGRQLQTLTGVLNSTMDHFTQESGTYVQQTLDRFDENLAEIVTRLAQTTTEIQDAVDALPAAIQRGAQFGS